MSERWVVVDVETSGMSPSTDRVLSVAALAIDAEGSVIEEFCSLLNPGVDPGPVHVHGLTPALLAGQPRFCDVLPALANILAGSTVVAHNAIFDVSFLAAEAARCGSEPLVEQFLCTLDLAGRLHLSTPDLKLCSLAAHFGVQQRAAHDARDDALVLAGVFTGMQAMAAEKHVELAVRAVGNMAPNPESGYLVSRSWAEALAAPRTWRSAGKLRRGGALVQGMEVVFTPDVDRDPEELLTPLIEAGLYVADRISSKTSLAVCDAPGAVRGRAAFARRKGLELIGTAQLVDMLADVRPGRLLAARSQDESQEALF